MLINRKRKLSASLLLLLPGLVLSSCAAEKKPVDPYRDSSYTSSVASERPVTRPAPAAQETLPERNVAMAPAPDLSRPAGDKSSTAMLPLLTLVDDRIVAYEGKAEQWEKFISEASTIKLDVEQQDKIADCQNRLLNILRGYNQLHQQLISESNGHAADMPITENFLATERQDINFLESACHQIIMSSLQAGGWVEGTRERLLEEKELEIQERLASREYQQVVDLYTQLPLEEGQKPSYESSYSYGQALLRIGRENDAAEVFQDLLFSLQEQNQIEREFKLMQLIADLQFGMENYEKAFERYIDIINRYAGLGENIDWARKQQSVISARNSQGIEVRNFAELMRGYLTYNAERDAFRVHLQATRFLADFPNSIVIPTVNHILYESRDRAEAWFALVLQRISGLKIEGKYQDALQIIDQLPAHDIPADKMELLNVLNDELVSASFEEEESRRLAVEEAMQEIWSKGQDFLREKEYDQAIEVFSSLLETTYADRANDKIIEASQLAAQEDRRKAAELFVLSSKTDDRNTRIDLLFQSRQLLSGILTKYPQSGLIEKAQKNLERIEEEIRSIDPALLTEPAVPTEETQILQQPVETTVNGVPIGQWEEQVKPGFPNQ